MIANFSPLGDVVVLGQAFLRTVFIAATADGSELLRFENLTFSSFADFNFQWNSEATRLAIGRIDSVAQQAYFQLLDRPSGRILDYPVQREYCPIFFDVLGILALRTSPRLPDGTANPICNGSNVSSAALGSLLFPSGRYLGFHGGLSDLENRVTHHLRTQIPDEWGIPRSGMVYPNAGETEAFAVWSNFRIEGYAIEPSMFEGSPLVTYTLPDQFTWLDGSVSPDRRQIVLTTRNAAGKKIVAIENPFFKPILRKPRLTKKGIEISWVGSSGEFEVFTTDSVTSDKWRVVAKTAERTVSFPQEAESRFYRVSGGNR